MNWDEFDSYKVVQSFLDSKYEVERYLFKPVQAKASTFEILTWWKLNSLKYPILTRIAYDILAILIAIVPFQLVFSTRNLILDPFRSSSAPKTTEDFICVQNWLICNPTMGKDEANEGMSSISETTEDPKTY